MKLILVSATDQAARNISARLLEFYDFESSTSRSNIYLGKKVQMMIVDGESTKIESLPVQAEEVIVASRHASETGKPSLTVHVPGEPGKGQLALANPSTVKTALRSLRESREEMGLDYEVSLEATHHGPTGLAVPVTFVEIGSGPEQWADRRAGEAAAHAIMKAVSPEVKCLNAVGLGGPHYAPRHTEITLETDVGVGHILPKYVSFDEGLVELAVRRTCGGAQLLVLDWKGLSEEQRKVAQRVAERLGIRAQRSREIIERKKL
ncbi:MAG: hypothetical protein APZ16_05930 [Candidatus Hadarchaeum yellowstonense]|jgi:D-aminoacyl-tRNA deacylase|uniref:D-aminoacyl-tRNA deacylase n=1 Tax=Hadarchaeum yellowstonense TaxID=1776334 RepID=A0A147JUI6_HADYE|nr:MAG: hypothetical protein APZ16_05930 [Candidatus Hadarchaeum yellowstonense]